MAETPVVTDKSVAGRKPTSHPYGCISPGGEAVTIEDGQTLFFEVPASALKGGEA
jgi:hypothetical protein